MLWETFERGRIISWYHPRFNTNSLFYKYRHSYLITGKISEHHISLLEPAIPTVLGFAAKPALSTAYSFHLLDVHPKIIVNMMKRQLILLLLLWPISCTVGIEEDELSLITNTWKTNTEKRNISRHLIVFISSSLFSQPGGVRNRFQKYYLTWTCLTKTAAYVQVL
ncbi:uncharacterized protein LOC143248297 isoform X5 [Tachypleus tridentatus]|uniref:uncharacterized protein LOC143248297 isoform X5 n=1 Tax=Tachypleus tridentatus TaxID=6853 RepID=UPI003FD04532